MDNEIKNKQLLKTLINGISIWLVDGKFVRDNFSVDFTQGGHDLVYKFIPSKEIWIDSDVKEDERIFIIVHEIHERKLMSMYDWHYDKAHQEASVVELSCRHNPRRLSSYLEGAGYPE